MHRRPLGTTCRTTADWHGQDPYLHDALVTQAGTWYRIVGVEETPSLVAALLLPVEQRSFKIRLLLERVADQQPEQDDIEWPLGHIDHVTWPDGHVGAVHGFRWYERKRKVAA